MTVDVAVFESAARKALASFIECGVSESDLSQDLWVWYLESPYIQTTLEGLNGPQRRAYALRGAKQILSKATLNGDRFNGKTLYSSDAIKLALKGGHDHKYLGRVLPTAVGQHADRNPKQAEAIRSRYTDGLVPVRGSAAEALLKRAVKSLTEEVNVLYLTDDTDCVGSAGSVFPDTRKRKGEHSDPTGNIALALLEDELVRDSYFEEETLTAFLDGEVAHPVFTMDGRKIRITAAEAELPVDRVRDLIQERMGEC